MSTKGTLKIKNCHTNNGQRGDKRVTRRESEMDVVRDNGDNEEVDLNKTAGVMKHDLL
jgi:hypothetical protein